MGVRGSVALALSVLLAAACGSTQAALSSATGSPTPTPTQSAPSAPCTDPVKCSTPPPGYTPPLPAPCDFPLSTADQIRAAAAHMDMPPGQTPPPRGTAAYGEPLLVHALRVGDPDAWLVPMTDGQGGASQVVAVGIRANGHGCAGVSSGWSGPFPSISEAAAKRRGAGPNDPVATIEAVFLQPARELPVSWDTQFVWRIVRASGYEVFLFANGDLYPRDLVLTLLGRGSPGDQWRGEPAVTSSAFVWPPRRYPVGSASEVLSGLAADPFFVEYLRYLRDQTAYQHPAVDDPRADGPLRVRGLATTRSAAITDEWLVPMRDRAGSVVSIIEVTISSQDGQGYAFAARGWSGPFPAVSEADAREIGSIRGIEVASAELMWGPEEIVAPGGPMAPFWWVTLKTGDHIVVTEDRMAHRAPD
jgi:hypothetical protein